MIVFDNSNPTSALDIARKTVRAHKVHQRGVDGTGIRLAIIEHGNVSGTNHLINLANSHRPANNPLGDDHATRVAFVAASVDPTLLGIAKGATIYSAGHNGLESDLAWALNWAFDTKNSDTANESEWWSEDNQLHAADRIMDYYIRSRMRQVAVAAGNKTPAGTFFVGSPGKAWNAITVGGAEDSNTTNWSDDSWNGLSKWMNSNHNTGLEDHEKPEVLAASKPLTTKGKNEILQENGDGATSFAAPMITGLIALLIKRSNSHYNNILYWPQAIRAIIFASALHNIEGDVDISPSDLKDGVGEIVAVRADDIVQLRSFDQSNPCNPSGDSCWWAFGFNNTNFPISTYKYLKFNAVGGKRVRVAISWDSNPDNCLISDCASDTLATDFDMCVLSPTNSFIPGGTVPGDGEDQTSGTSQISCSTSYLNNYELVDFTAPRTGEYKIRIKKSSASEISNNIGIAVYVQQ